MKLLVAIGSLTRSKFLSIVLTLDGLLHLGFGMVSWYAPHATFGTIFDLSDANDSSLILATLASLSIFYVLIGLVCFLAARSPHPHKARLSLVITLDHSWIGLKGYHEIGQAWLIGNPWPDIVIHSAFVCVYAALLLLSWKGSRSSS